MFQKIKKLALESIRKAATKLFTKLFTKTCKSCDETVPLWKVGYNFGKGKCLCSSCIEIGVREDEFDFQDYLADQAAHQTRVETPAAS